MINQHLIEPNTRACLMSTLEQCHKNRVTYYGTLFNVLAFIAIVVLFGAVCYFRRKPVLTAEQQRQQELDHLRYIAERVKQFNVHQRVLGTSSSSDSTKPLWSIEDHLPLL
jgi:hypothetical protein